MAETKVIIKGSIILNVVLVVAVVFLGLMLAREGGCCAPPCELDTSDLIISEEPHGPPVPPELPKGAGRAEPTRDTVWMMKLDTIRFPIPDWRIALVDYRNATLKVVAVKPIKDSSEVYSATWYAPGGFRLQVLRDLILVDTFPHPSPVVEQPSKIWRWVMETGFEYVALDSTVTFLRVPFVSVGGELGPLRLGRTSWTLTPAQLMWASGSKSYGGVLAVGCKLSVRF